MAEQKFQDGTVVRLKSGGPKMTVSGYGKYGYGSTDTYKCKWFDDKNNLIEHTFDEEDLEAVSASSGGGHRLERG
jgi:uncharacterized protein YodC (DUF2158 family)